MKTLIIKGKHAGETAEVSQWCNDWFTLDSQKYGGEVFSPTQLAFTKRGMDIITNHNNNGTLFMEYDAVRNRDLNRAYQYTFEKKKPEDTGDRHFLKPAEALKLLCINEDNTVHVFKNPNGAMLVGADWSLDSVKKAIIAAKTVEIGGSSCVGMGHGIVVIPKGAKMHSDVLFIKHDGEKMKKYL